MSEARTKMYQTVREALDQECTRTYAEGLAALAALEAEERGANYPRCVSCHSVEDRMWETPDGRRWCHRHAGGHDSPAIEVETTSPAPPAAEAIADAFARDFFVRHDHTYSGIEIYEWLKKQVTGPVAPPAAECAARKAMEEFTEELRRIVNGMSNGSLPDPGTYDVTHALKVEAKGRYALAAPCECQRLRDRIRKQESEYLTVCAELDEARAQLSALAEVRDLQIGRLRAELTDTKSEIARLTAESQGWRAIVDCRDDELHAIEHAVGFYGNRGELVRVITAIIAKRDSHGAELRQAVDALRPFALLGKTRGPLRWADCDAAIVFVAAYDAKHGERRAI